MAHVPTGQDRFHQGYYKIKNIEKYIGDPTQIVYRSSQEYKFMLQCDLHKEVIKWGSEVFKVPYIDKDGKNRIYIPDFYLETINKQNPDFMNKFVVEIKPEAEIREPEIPVNISEKKFKQLEYKLSAQYKNKYKWAYVIEQCKKRDLQFQLITEKHLGRFKA